jgi:hypothetical protein
VVAHTDNIKGQNRIMKTDRLRSLKGFRPYLFIAAATVAAHGLILLNQGVFWDGWLRYTFLIEHSWQNLYTDYFLPAGRPTKALLFWFLGFFPDPIVAYHWLTLGMLVGTGCLIYAIGIKTKWLTSFESVALAILTIAYPAFKVAFEFTFFPHVLSYFLFALGTWLSFAMVDHTVGSIRVLLRILSLLAFALSFTVESFLVFYYWFLILLFIKMAGEGQPVSHYIRCLVRLADYALLPIVYWVMGRYAFPASGIYAQLTAFQWGLASIGNAFYRFIRYAIWRPLGDFHVLVWLFVLAVLSLLRLSWDLKLGKGKRDYLVLLAGIVGLLCAILPYAIVGKSPGPEGWETRHALLIGLPAALTLIGLLRLGFSGQQQSSVVVFSIVAVLVAGFCYDLWGNYIEWQSRWVKDSAIIANLRELDEEEVAKVSVYLIDDHTRLAGEEPYRFYEWAGLFREAWGTETHIGLTSKYRVEEFLHDNPNADLFFSETYLMSDVDPSGCRATLTILYAERVGDLELALRYFYFKFLKPADLNDFLLRSVLMDQHSFECK